jgi:hypothetical protein
MGFSPDTAAVSYWHLRQEILLCSHFIPVAVLENLSMFVVVVANKKIRLNQPSL